MAQRKDKLDWYQAQCDMFDADKIQKILIRFRREQHIEVFGTIHLMLAKVYGDKGYYAHWDVESQALFAAHHGSLTPEYVGEITAACCQQRMFSLNVYEKMDVLTSEAIICNYLGAVKKRTFRRDEPTPMISDYLPNTHAVRNGIIGAGNNLVLVDTNGVLVDLNLYLGVQVSPINVEEKRGDTEEVLDGKKGVLDGQNSALDLALSEEERATYKEFEQAHGMIIPDQDKQRRAVRDLWGWAEKITAVNGEAGLKPGPFLTLLLASLAELREADKSKGGFWRDLPCLPARVWQRKDLILEHARRRFAGRQAGESEYDKLLADVGDRPDAI